MSSPTSDPRSPQIGRSPNSIPLRSPVSRPELSSRQTRRVQQSPEGPQSPTSGNDGRPFQTAVIYGTNIEVDYVMNKLRNFLVEFEANLGFLEDTTIKDSKYVRKLAYCVTAETEEVDVDLKDIYSYDVGMYTQFLTYPQEMISIFDSAVSDLVKDIADHRGESYIPVVIVNIFNPLEADKKALADLNPEEIDQLVCVKGMVTRVSSIIPDLQVAHFECGRCGSSIDVNVEQGVVDHPTACPAGETCGRQFTMQMIHNRSRFIDKQIVSLQESPDDLQEGKTPVSVSVIVFKNKVQAVRPGDRVEITAIYRASSSRTNAHTRNVRAVFRTFLDLVHVRRVRSGQLFSEEEGAVDKKGTKEQQEQYKKLLEISKRDDVYDLLVKSLAPSIYELDDIKRGILALIFGGVSKTIKGAKLRGEINCLLVGDPSTAKSQLLLYVQKIVPRGIYTSGKGSSAVGLTAYVTKDPDTKEIVLESGALVLSDQGVCCIDEFDKMSQQARTMLHEVMEQQTISVAKAGIVASLNARASILAAANPIESRYNPRQSVVANIDLPPTLLSRFDLIYLVLDQVQEAKDTRLARHIIGMYLPNPPELKVDHLDVKTITQYVAYARNNIKPKLSEEAGKQLITEYLFLRGSGNNTKVITAVPRQLESLIRISEGLAKMEWNETVEVRHVKEAVRLIRVALQSSATDPVTGQIDMSLLSTGKTTGDWARLDTIANEIVQVLANLQEPRVAQRVVFEELRKKNAIERDVFNQALTLLSRGARIMVTRDYVQLLNR